MYTKKYDIGKDSIVFYLSILNIIFNLCYFNKQKNVVKAVVHVISLEFVSSVKFQKIENYKIINVNASKDILIIQKMYVNNVQPIVNHVHH